MNPFTVMQRKIDSLDLITEALVKDRPPPQKIDQKIRNCRLLRASQNDMNTKALAEVLRLPEGSTENDILNAVRNLVASHDQAK